MNMNKKIARIGITMRVVDTPGYQEFRDALAQDWQEFMAYALPEVQWVPIPNLGQAATDFLKNWAIDGVILSGGNNVGSCLQRDTTEKTILKYCIENDIPVFGVCRGLQMMQTFFGGSLSACPKEKHVATEHNILITRESFEKFYSPKLELKVNSFHQDGILKSALSPQLQSWAITDEDWVEGVEAKEYQMRAVMWHPERGRPLREEDRQMIRHFFGWGDIR